MRWNWIFSKSSLFPELAGIDVTERKRAIKACRRKAICHWQAWVATVLVGIAWLALLLIAAIWYLNFSMRLFSQLPMSILALLALFFFLSLLYIKRKVFSYCLSPHAVRAISDSDAAAVMTEHNRLQQLRKRSIRGGIIFSVLILLAAVASGVVVANSPSSGPSPLPIPEELQIPKVITNLPGLTKRALVEEGRVGHVTDIAFRTNAGKDQEMIISGTEGALFIGADRSTRFVEFGERQDHVDHIRLDRQGTSGFMNRGAWCSDALVMDESGRILWSCSAGENGIDDMASGDMDGDGNPEFAVGFNGGGGIRLLDSQGKKRWEVPDANVWHVEFTDLDGDGRQEIIHSNAGGKITVRDSQGLVVSKSRPACYFSDFSLIRWPDANSPERFLQAENDTIWILDAGAKTLARFPAPAAGNLGEGRGALIALQDGTRVLATVVDFSNWNRSVVYLHDLSAKLLYQEILPESCRSLAVAPREGTGAESLLVGCDGKVIEYRMEKNIIGARQ